MEYFPFFFLFENLWLDYSLQVLLDEYPSTLIKVVWLYVVFLSGSSEGSTLSVSHAQRMGLLIGPMTLRRSKAFHTMSIFQKVFTPCLSVM